MNIQGIFDANQHVPKQLGASLPPGKYPFQISNTYIKPTKENDGGMFVVEFTTPAGDAVMRYNLWNNSSKAVEIAHGQLSALCHATGVFKVDYANEGAALRGAQGMLEIGWQKGQEPTAEKPEGGYTEVKRVFDKAGNEPGKAPASAPAVAGAQWNGSQPASPVTPAAPSWGAATKPADPVGAAPAAWQPGPAQPPANNPPWANK